MVHMHLLYGSKHALQTDEMSCLSSLFRLKSLQKYMLDMLMNSLWMNFRWNTFWALAPRLLLSSLSSLCSFCTSFCNAVPNGGSVEQLGPPASIVIAIQGLTWRGPLWISLCLGKWSWPRPSDQSQPQPNATEWLPRHLFSLPRY